MIRHWNDPMITYAPTPEGKGKGIGIVADKLLTDWAAELVRRAVNRWLYSELVASESPNSLDHIVAGILKGADNDKG